MTGLQKTTPLTELHVELGAKMAEFAGYNMPINYPTGIIAEHQHTRESAGLFDVSHMGQITISGDNVAQWLETILPIDVIDLPLNRQRYAIFTQDDGTILDDLMVQHTPDGYVLVVNAACKDNDLRHCQEKLGEHLNFQLHDDLGLLALQGPNAEAVLADISDDANAIKDMVFMDVGSCNIDGISCVISRSGYTGEDGFEISMPATDCGRLAQKLLADERVKPIGLGARDSLRLEAGLSLYGHEIDDTLTPVEGGIVWSISKVRRQNGDRPGNFPGADVILGQISEGVEKKLLGLTPEGRAPVREGCIIVDADGEQVGTISSGTFSPSLNHPITMGHVNSNAINDKRDLFAQVRKKLIPLTPTKLPFVSHRYKR